jgi:hypothetical protein
MDIFFLHQKMQSDQQIAAKIKPQQRGTYDQAK